MESWQEKTCFFLSFVFSSFYLNLVVVNPSCLYVLRTCHIWIARQFAQDSSATGRLMISSGFCQPAFGHVPGCISIRNQQCISESFDIYSLFFWGRFLLKVLGLFVCLQCHKLRHSQSYMTSGFMSTADGYPTLCCKAFNGRLMVMFLDACVHTLADSIDGPANPEILNACLASRTLCMWFDRLERSPRFLTNSQRVELHALGLKYVGIVERLAIIGLLTHVSRWRLQPKLHSFVHIAEDHLKFGVSGRSFHCFCDEDHVGLIKRLALKCHRNGWH